MAPGGGRQRDAVSRARLSGPGDDRGDADGTGHTELLDARKALDHRGPHLLSLAAVDHDLARDRIAAWTSDELADPDAVLIVDETGDEKSSTDCVGAARQYSGALGGIGLRQVTVRLTYTSRHGHAPIDRALYLGAEWAADEERRLRPIAWMSHQ
ncbi:SRSO17 transposase [Streptomyces pseudovenezuelae]|uniref:SRSO17 transposase n=1 Tax=Streptomyces pseudovenezuelae TaxID=67350 RepID=A0ABT6M179_9ACTN|nr:transposase [Streptomyces pseudovenezuelae]MDH6221726.1 SRSO17 transposase [Streptomyces pseudovenezuelae]